MKKILLNIGMLLLIICSIVQRGFTEGMRIVVLYPAVSPILKELGAGKWVVGVTRHDTTFPSAVKVGSHLRPNLELVKALKPDLLIVGSKRAFPPEEAKKFKTKIFRYDPRTLKGILKKIRLLGKELHKQKQAEQLIKKLSLMLKKVKKLPRHPGVIFEVMSTPLRVSGAKDITTDIIHYAGGKNLITLPRKHVSISPEKILALSPEFYIYQVGPMNRHPVPPNKRPYFKTLKACVIKVKESEFSRPGINSFKAVLKLNRIFYRVIAQKKGCPGQDRQK